MRLDLVQTTPVASINFSKLHQLEYTEISSKSLSLYTESLTGMPTIERWIDATQTAVGFFVDQ